MHWPWKLVRRSTLEADRARLHAERVSTQERLDEFAYAAYRARERAQTALVGCEKAQRRADDVFRDCAKLVSDLRLVAFHVSQRSLLDDRRLEVRFEIRSEMFWHGFRGDQTFRQVLAYMLEDTIMRDPELYRSIHTGGPTTRKL